MSLRTSRNHRDRVEKSERDQNLLRMSDIRQTMEMMSVEHEYKSTYGGECFVEHLCWYLRVHTSWIKQDVDPTENGGSVCVKVKKITGWNNVSETKQYDNKQKHHAIIWYNKSKDDGTTTTYTVIYR